MRTVSIPTGVEPSSERLAPLLSTLPLELRPDMEAFIRGAFQVNPGVSLQLLGCVGCCMELLPGMEMQPHGRPSGWSGEGSC